MFLFRMQYTPFLCICILEGCVFTFLVSLNSQFMMGKYAMYNHILLNLKIHSLVTKLQQPMQELYMRKCKKDTYFRCNGNHRIVSGFSWAIWPLWYYILSALHTSAPSLEGTISQLPHYIRPYIYINVEHRFQLFKLINRIVFIW